MAVLLLELATNKLCGNICFPCSTDAFYDMSFQSAGLLCLTTVWSKNTCLKSVSSLAGEEQVQFPDLLHLLTWVMWPILPILSERPLLIANRHIILLYQRRAVVLGCNFNCKTTSKAVWKCLKLFSFVIFQTKISFNVLFFK